jgi:methylmalonyl-CoA mutase N-terminal domain/subunit
VITLDPELQKGQLERLKDVRGKRDQGAVDAALASLEAAARSDGNLLYPMREALGAYATLGEVSNTLRGVFGEYEPGAGI